MRKWKNRSGTLTYWVWRNMRRRCYDTENQDYMSYGGRGISVCDRWRYDYDAFVEDMGIKPFGKTIDRIEVNGNYTPKNCRWATDLEQGANRRNNLFVTYQGETKHSSEWARVLGINEASFRNRLQRFDDLEVVFYKGRLKTGRGPARKVLQYDL